MWEENFTLSICSFHMLTQSLCTLPSIQPTHSSDDKEIELPIKWQLSALGVTEALQTVSAGSGEEVFLKVAFHDGGSGTDDANVGDDDPAPTDESSRDELGTAPCMNVLDGVEGDRCDGFSGTFGRAVEPGWSLGDTDTASTSTTLDGGNLGWENQAAAELGPLVGGFETSATSTVCPPYSIQPMHFGDNRGIALPIRAENCRHWVSRKLSQLFMRIGLKRYFRRSL